MRSILNTCAFFIFLCLAQAQSPQLLKSIAGPSGQIVDGKFVMNEVRNRFTYPADKSLVIYFEWTGSLGMHNVSGVWKDSTGRAASISSDIQVEARTPTFAAFWNFDIVPTMAAGIWTLDVRVDGQPAGSHSFDLVISLASGPPSAAPTAVEPKPAPSLDEIYKSNASLVWIHKLDSTGKRRDAGTGFIIGPDRIVTAFQVIDSAAGVEIEFSDHRSVKVESVVGLDRGKDWAVLAAPTGKLLPFPRGDVGKIAIGQRYIVFNSANPGVREIGGVDLTGRQTLPQFGERWVLNPSPAVYSTGGPLLDLNGAAIGILGGSLTPGSRFDRRDMSVSPSLWANLGNANLAVPLSYVIEGKPVTFAELATNGVLTAPIQPTTNLVTGGTALTIPKAPGAMPADVSAFSRKEAVAFVYTLWQKREKQGKGVFSMHIVDFLNKTRVKSDEKKINVPTEVPIRVATSFAPSSLEVGYYRVEILWNDVPVWRTFFQIRE